MDQVQQEQASMREEIDSVKSKIDQILETISALAIREYDVRNVTAIRNDGPVQGPTPYSRPSVLLPNHVTYGPPPGVTPPFEGITTQSVHTYGFTNEVVAQGSHIVNQILIPRTDEELQDEYKMQNYHGFLWWSVMLLLRIRKLSKCDVPWQKN